MCNNYIVLCILFQNSVIVFTMNTIYISTYSTVVLLAPLMLVVVEKAIYETTS